MPCHIDLLVNKESNLQSAMSKYIDIFAKDMKCLLPKYKKNDLSESEKFLLVGFTMDTLRNENFYAGVTTGSFRVLCCTLMAIGMVNPAALLERGGWSIEKMSSKVVLYSAAHTDPHQQMAAARAVSGIGGTFE